MPDPRSYIPGGPPQYLARSVMASFLEPAAAEEAVRELRRSGHEPDLARVNALPVDRSDLRQPRAASFPRGLGEEPDTAKAPASQSGPGQPAEEGPRSPAGRLGRVQWLVTVPVADDSMRRGVEDILRRHGGAV